MSQVVSVKGVTVRQENILWASQTYSNGRTYSGMGAGYQYPKSIPIDDHKKTYRNQDKSLFPTLNHWVLALSLGKDIAACEAVGEVLKVM